MTPAQEALRNYFIEKMKEGIFANATSPGDALKKAGVAFLVDAPTVLGEMGVQGLARVALGKVEEIARDVQKRGLRTVFSEIAQSLDMQYQRGMERKRKSRR